MGPTRHHRRPCSFSSFHHRTARLPSSGEPSGVSTTLPCPIQSLPERVDRVHHRPRYAMRVSTHLLVVVEIDWSASGKAWKITFFLNCLWIASSASFIVTPFKFRAVTSSPRGKCRSIFLTGGVVRNFLRASLSSKVDGEVFNFLFGRRSVTISHVEASL